MRTGAQILWDALRREGVEVVFGYPGGAIMPAYDALLESPIRHVLVRHEQGAAHMADGYARVSGKVGVAIATSGPGATNLVTGIATAMLDSVPLVCITGQVASKFLGSDAFQETDITGVTLRWTPAPTEMLNPSEEVPAIRDAIRAGLITPSEAIRDRGLDPDTFFAEWKADADTLDALDLIFDSDPRKVTAVGNPTFTGKSDASKGK